jgi:hypothetical protein
VWVRIGSFPVNADQVVNLRNTYNQIAGPKVRASPGNLGCRIERGRGRSRLAGARVLRWAADFTLLRIE